MQYVYVSSNRLTHQNSNSVYMYEGMNIRVDGEMYVISSIRRQTLQIEAHHAVDSSKHVVLDINSPRISIDEEARILAYQVWLSTLCPGMSIDVFDAPNATEKTQFTMATIVSISEDTIVIYIKDKSTTPVIYRCHEFTPAYLQKGNTASWGHTSTDRFTFDFPIWGCDLPDSETNNRITAGEGAFSAGPILFQHTYPIND